MPLFTSTKTITLKQATFLFDRLGNTTTLRVIYLLRTTDKKINVKAIFEVLNMPQNVVSGALKALREQEILKYHENGRKWHYYVADEFTDQIDSILQPLSGDRTLESDVKNFWKRLSEGHLAESTIDGVPGCVYSTKE